MKILTWNIFFDLEKLHERTHKIVDISTETNADIICFQEVRNKTLDFLIQSMLKRGYILPSQELQSKRVKGFMYSTLTFVKSTFTNISTRIIPHVETNMSRDILEVIVDNIPIYNVHLESTNSLQFKLIREKQLLSLLNLVNQSPCLVCGDFNITGPILNSCGFNPNVKEFTLVNTYFSERFNSGSTFAAPYDRVMYNNSLSCTLLGYLGNEIYDDLGYCSDHNGILFEVAV